MSKSSPRETELLLSYVMRPSDPTGYLLKKEGSK